MLTDTLFVGQRKTFDLTLAAPAGAAHPITLAEWRIVAHRGPDGSESVRPLGTVTPAVGGKSAEVHAHAWPGSIEIEVAAHAPHPKPADPMGVARSTTFTETMVITIAEVPELAPDLELTINPAGDAR